MERDNFNPMSRTETAFVSFWVFSSEDLQEYFKKYGTVTDSVVMRDASTNTKRSRYAYCTRPEFQTSDIIHQRKRISTWSFCLVVGLCVFVFLHCFPQIPSKFLTCNFFGILQRHEFDGCFCSCH